MVQRSCVEFTLFIRTRNSILLNVLEQIKNNAYLSRKKLSSLPRPIFLWICSAKQIHIFLWNWHSSRFYELALNKALGFR